MILLYSTWYWSGGIIALIYMFLVATSSPSSGGKKISRYVEGNCYLTGFFIEWHCPTTEEKMWGKVTDVCISYLRVSLIEVEGGKIVAYGKKQATCDLKRVTPKIISVGDHYRGRPMTEKALKDQHWDFNRGVKPSK